MSRIPPFFENHDGTHCYQCSLRGALEHFNPDQSWSWTQLEELTGKKPGLYTWFFKTCAELPALGYNVTIISELDIPAFAENPKAAIESFYSAEGAADQIENSDLEAEQTYAKKMLENLGAITIHKRSFTVDDLKYLLDDGYLIIPQINPYKLVDKPGYSGHAVLLYDHEGDEGLYHENGNGPKSGKRAQRKPLEKFVEAALDNGKMEGLIAIRLPTNE